MVTTAKNLKKLIKQLKMNAYGFSCELEVNRSIICLYLQGKRKPNLDTCRRIIDVARKYGIEINLDYLRPDLGINFND